MHIVYIHQFFCTNEGSSGTRSYDVSRHLASMGHKVTMICGATEGSGLDRPHWYKLIQRRRLAGFDLLVCNVPYSQKMSKWGRLAAFLKFAALATMASVFHVRRPDVIFTTSLPLTVGIPGYLGGLFHRVPFVFEVRDLYPETDIIAGYIREGSLMERCLSSLERFIYRKASKILLVSPGFKTRLIERGYPAEKMRVALLGADGDIFRNVRPSTNFRAKHGLEGKTVAVYTGAHGTANGLDYVLDAAAILKDRRDIAFVLIGDGNEKPNLQRKVRELRLENVAFVDSIPKTDLPGILAACDIGLMILRHVGQARPVTPNKIFDYMFAGLPSVVNFEGPTIEMVREDGTGVFADPLNPRELADRVGHWADHRDEAKAVGTRARQLAYEKYDRRSIAVQLAGIFEEARR